MTKRSVINVVFLCLSNNRSTSRSDNVFSVNCQSLFTFDSDILFININKTLSLVFYMDLILFTLNEDNSAVIVFDGEKCLGLAEITDKKRLVPKRVLNL